MFKSFIYKKLLFLFACLFLFKMTIGQTQQIELPGSEDSVLNQLLTINDSLFIGKPLDSIIAKLPLGYVKMYGVGGSRPQIITCLRIVYPKNVFIELYVWEFTHMSRISTTTDLSDGIKWDVNLMRKEKLHHIIVFQHIFCLRNCDLLNTL